MWLDPLKLRTAVLVISISTAVILVIEWSESGYAAWLDRGPAA